MKKIKSMRSAVTLLKILPPVTTLPWQSSLFKIHIEDNKLTPKLQKSKGKADVQKTNACQYKRSPGILLVGNHIFWLKLDVGASVFSQKYVGGNTYFRNYSLPPHPPNFSSFHKFLFINFTALNSISKMNWISKMNCPKQVHLHFAWNMIDF